MEDKKETARAAIVAAIEASGLTWEEAHNLLGELQRSTFNLAFKGLFVSTHFEQES